MPASLLAPTGTRNLRRARFSQRYQIYHITAATLDRKRVFTGLSAGRAVVQSLRHETEVGRCETLCFMLMPDHLHWLMQLKRGESISRIVNDVKGHSARRLNQLLGQRGRIWQKGFTGRPQWRAPTALHRGRLPVLQNHSTAHRPQVCNPPHNWPGGPGELQK